MKKSKAESLLLIAVLAFSIQTGSYSAALSNGELNQIYVENTAEPFSGDSQKCGY